MDELEKIMRNHADHQDELEPFAGHFDRFESKLEKRFPVKKKSLLIPSLLKIAAIGLLVLMSTMWVYQSFFSGISEQSGMGLADISPEMAETEFFFTSNIQQTMDQISHFSLVDPQLKQELLETELANLDTMYFELKEELEANPGNEQIVDAMILHYQTKLDILNRILQELKRVKNLKNTNNETTQI